MMDLLKGKTLKRSHYVSYIISTRTLLFLATYNVSVSLIMVHQSHPLQPQLGMVAASCPAKVPLLDVDFHSVPVCGCTVNQGASDLALLVRRAII